MNYTPRRSVRFELLTGSEAATASRVSLNSQTGRFEIQDVVSGTYLLRAVQDQSSGAIPVQVKAGDVAGVSVTLLPHADIKGTIRFVDSLAEPAGARTRYCRTSLYPAGLDGLTYPAAMPNPGEFFFAKVMPGSYRVGVDCFGGYVRSVMSGALDLLANPILTVQPGAGPPPIEITANSGGGSIRARISARTNDSTILLLAVPQFAATTGPSLHYAAKSAGDTWSAQTGVLAPGTYLLYAFAGPRDIEYRNPEVLQSLRGGIPVQVGEQGAAEAAIEQVIR